MKRAISACLTALQLLLLAGAAVLHRLSYARMGVMRHVTQRNAKWEKVLPVELLHYLLAAVLLAAALYGTAGLVRRRGATRPLVGLTVLALAAALFVFLATPGLVRVYYYLCALFSAVVALALVKCALGKTKL